MDNQIKGVPIPSKKMESCFRLLTPEGKSIYASYNENDCWIHFQNKFKNLNDDALEKEIKKGWTVKK